jgi:hypothetical protein
MGAKLQEIKEGLRRRWHLPIPDTGRWLGQIIAGYFAYHAVPTNSAAIGAFRYHVTVLWHRRLCRRSQTARLCGRGWRSWRMIFSPSRGSFTPGPVCALPSDTRGRSRVPELGLLGSVRGAVRNERPTSNI